MPNEKEPESTKMRLDGRDPRLVVTTNDFLAGLREPRNSNHFSHCPFSYQNERYLAIFDNEHEVH
jgi:hypothetical protein